MTAKEYLNQIRAKDNEINRKQQKLEALRNIAFNTSPHYESEAVQRTREKSPLENIMVKIVDLDKEIDSDIDALVDLKVEVWEQLDKMNDESQKRILWLRYAEYKTWSNIADVINFTPRYVYKLHIKALDELDAILKNGTV